MKLNQEEVQFLRQALAELDNPRSYFALMSSEWERSTWSALLRFIDASPRCPTWFARIVLRFVYTERWERTRQR